MAGVLHWVASGADALPERCGVVVAAMAGQGPQVLAGDPPPVRARGVQLATLPPLSGRPWPARLKMLAGAMAGFDLVCTWGGGALDAVLAHTLFADVYHLPPLVHHEGTGAGRSNLYRRIALGRSAAIIVPDAGTERIALERWQQPRTRVRLIADGVELAPFGRAPKRDALPGLVKRRDEKWLAVPADGNVPALIAALPRLPEQWQLVVWGAGADRPALLAAAAAVAQDHRVLFAGDASAQQLLPLCDLFAATGPLPSVTVLQVMATGLPLVAPRGAVHGLPASANGPLLVPDAAALADVLVALADDADRRAAIGQANRAQAVAEHDAATTVERHRALYRGLMRRPAPV
ncbi:glycosyltransferase [Croceibacterium mercuriale]|uniref:glycosyltransferase n=1 Tax=Croceibacterium mercuriale TaxID=1572751 RepID=UPI00068F6CC5|nr:glycosyltransferase [Croceibacterium mercuriale]